MTRLKLQTIAANMRAAVAQHDTGWTAAVLPGGLELVLSHQAEAWRLALRRERVYPSATEEAILAEVFAVPEGTEPARRSKTEAAKERQVRWCVSEFCWREA
jgi:hypothetical protein